MGELQRMRGWVEALATPDGRMIGTAGHERGRSHLRAWMRETGLVPYAGEAYGLAYRGEGHNLENLLGVIPGRNREAAPVLLAAHHDTCGPLPGADDNAAAIAILLAAVEPVRALALERDVVLAFFDGEEPPLFHTDSMGSSHFYAHQRTGPVHCALVLDLCGHEVPIPGLEKLVFVTGAESDPELPGVLPTPAATRLRIQPLLNRYVGDMSDHYAFRVHGRPYLFLTCARWEHYHQATDTPDRLCYPKMRAIRDYVVELTGAVAHPALDGPREHDTLELELAGVRENFGPILDTLGVTVESRGDLDAFVSQAKALFGLY